MIEISFTVAGKERVQIDRLDGRTNSAHKVAQQARLSCDEGSPFENPRCAAG